MPLHIDHLICLRDNFVWLLRETDSGAVACVDPSEAAPVKAKLDQLGWKLTHILNTHHHNDHTGGNREIKEATGCIIVGPRADRDRIPGIDVQVGDGDIYEFGAEKARVFDVPGHTRGHIAYHFANSHALFCGDTLFIMGCGRVFEGTHAQMWNSLSKLKALPPETRVYCAHEYTQANARFALTVEPENDALRARAAEAAALAEENEPALPTTIAQELATNPFLRPTSPEIQQRLGMEGRPLHEIFGEIRRRKDRF